MTPTQQTVPPHAELRYEPNNWLSISEPQPETDADARELLGKPADPRPANPRHTRINGQVFLFADMRPGHPSLPDLAKYARMITGDSQPTEEVTNDDIECLLAETGHPWSGSGEAGHWQAVSSGRNRCELSATRVAGGVEIEAPLIAGDQRLSAGSREALPQFLLAAHSQIRFARFRLRDDDALVTSFATGDRLEIELADSVMAVIATYSLVWRQVRALADEQVARMYVEMNG